MTSKTDNRRSFDCVWRKNTPDFAQDDGQKQTTTRTDNGTGSDKGKYGDSGCARMTNLG